MTGAGALLVGASIAAFKIVDPERADLDDEVRAHAPVRFVRLSDGYTHYEISGPPDGRQVVLVPAFSVPYYLWDATFTALANATFRVLRYDYYGRGYSDRPPVAYQQALYVRQLTELLDAVGMKGPVDLVGASIGGSVITSLADRSPDRARSLVMVAPSFRHSFAPAFTEGIPSLWHIFTVLFDEPAWADQQLGDFAQPERFPDWPARYREQMRYRGFRHARLSDAVANADMEQVPEVERVGRHPRPVLLIFGKQDQTVPFSSSESLARILPRARVVAVESAGHLPQVEQPAVVNAAVIDFLRQ